MHLMGLLLLCNGGFMLVAALVSGLYKDGVTIEITISHVISLKFLKVPLALSVLVTLIPMVWVVVVFIRSYC